VTERSYNQKPVEAPGSPENFESSCLVLGAPPRMATLETCQLVVTWQHCWHGNNVEEFKLCMDYGQSIYGKSQHCTTAKK